MTNPSITTDHVLSEVLAERIRQDEKWGEQNHPDGTSSDYTSRLMATSARVLTEYASERGTLTWRRILDEEFHEVLAETDPVRLRTELVQVAAVAVAWAESIDRRLAESCAKCRRVFDPADARFDGRARHAETPFCRRCVAVCHEADAFHQCVICR
ncbi:hypothetical protein [Streptomyces sp. NPDC004042]|uniref:hypothetical protein n=1 Tax=Streptomyces sp. NPDC004042 TaxID=3154451 RepID=UPI0033B2FD4A